MGLPSPASAASGAVGDVFGFSLSAVFAAAGQWVASGAQWLLGQVGHALSASTTVDLQAAWFQQHASVMTALSAALVLPLLCAATLQAVYRHDTGALLRTFVVQLPLAMLATGVAMELVQMALSLTDALSDRVLAGGGVDAGRLLAPVSDFLGTGGPSVPAFVLFVGALVVAFASLVLWIELVVRAAAVTAAALFLPLVLAATVWPAVAHWCRRLVDTVVALVLSKLVVAAVLSLAAGALAGGLGLAGGADVGGAAAGATGTRAGFAAVIVGIALLLVATLSPFTLLRLVPAVEAGALAHLEGTRQRLHAALRPPLRTGGLALDVLREATMPGAGGVATATGDVASDTPSLPMLAGTPAAGFAGIAGAESGRHDDVVPGRHKGIGQGGHADTGLGHADTERAHSDTGLDRVDTGLDDGDTRLGRHEDSAPAGEAGRRHTEATLLAAGADDRRNVDARPENSDSGGGAETWSAPRASWDE